MSRLQTESLHFTRVPSMDTGMLIRKPVADVFEAIVNPEITTKAPKPWSQLNSNLVARERLSA